MKVCILMTDPIGDMLNRILNAQAVGKPTVEIPFSRITYGIAKILEKEGFIRSAEFKGKRAKKFVHVSIRYEDGNPVITGLKRVSKPGQRLYQGWHQIRRVQSSGRGIAIFSTSKGLKTDRQARKERVGGEVLCEVW